VLPDLFIDCVFQLRLVLVDSVDYLEGVLSKLSFQLYLDTCASDDFKESLNQIIIHAQNLPGVVFFVEHAIVVESKLKYQLSQLQFHLADLITFAKRCCLIFGRGAEPSTQLIYSVKLLDIERLLGRVLRLKEGCEARK